MEKNVYIISEAFEEFPLKVFIFILNGQIYLLYMSPIVRNVT